VYYTLLAVDKYYNDSHYSDTLMLKRPDTVAPAPAIIATAVVKSNAIQLGIVATTSTDVMSYYLQRIDISKPKDTLALAQWSPSVTKRDSLFFTDTTAEPGTTYQYLLYTLDSSINRSMNRSGLVAFEPGFRKAVDFK